MTEFLYTLKHIRKAINNYSPWYYLKSYNVIYFRLFTETHLKSFPEIESAILELYSRDENNKVPALLSFLAFYYSLPKTKEDNEKAIKVYLFY